MISYSVAEMIWKLEFLVLCYFSIGCSWLYNILSADSLNLLNLLTIFNCYLWITLHFRRHAHIFPECWQHCFWTVLKALTFLSCHHRWLLNRSGDSTHPQLIPKARSTGSISPSPCLLAMACILSRRKRCFFFLVLWEYLSWLNFLCFSNVE